MNGTDGTPGSQGDLGPPGEKVRVMRQGWGGGGGVEAGRDGREEGGGTGSQGDPGPPGEKVCVMGHGGREGREEEEEGREVQGHRETLASWRKGICYGTWWEGGKGRGRGGGGGREVQGHMQGHPGEEVCVYIHV